MTYAIKHLFHIDSKKEDVYKALTSIEALSKWWTSETSGNSSLNGIIQFRLGPNGGPDMMVKELIPNQKVVWECTESNHGWKGHKLSFQLDENEGKTRIRFSHDGWNEQNDFYAICSFTWGRYMESLRSFCQTGKGQPFESLTTTKN